LAAWSTVWECSQVAAGDRLAVERLCRLEDEAVALRAAIAEDGVTIERAVQNSKGEVIEQARIPHPALLPLRKLGSELQTLCGSLGLTPRGRQELGLDVNTEPEPPDELDELKARMWRRRAEEQRGGAQ